VAVDGVALWRALAASPRFSGTKPLTAARDRCRAALVVLGFSVVEQPFEFSILPARWGMPVVGGASTLLLAIVLWGQRSRGPRAAWMAMATAVAMLTLLVRWLTGPGAQRLRWARVSGVNLQATRGPEPRLWLVAHLDSKSQRYPLAWRALGGALLLAAWAGAVLATAMAWRGRPPLAFTILLVGVVGAALLGLGAVGNDSPGAVDNASGVAAVIQAASLLPAGVSVGVVITDAEELGLAGAHAWPASRRPGMAVNVDTLDDAGALRLLMHGARGGGLRGAVVRASERTSQRCRVRRLPPGVLTDGVALARAGWSTATLTRSTLRTLARIHTSRDCVGAMQGSAIASAAALLAAIVEEAP
jgi:hypothetical protein